MTDKSKTTEQTLRQAVEDSISVAVERGVLDAKANAAPIALLRRMADTLDSNHDPLTMRYCTPASFTSLFEKLGLMPTEMQLEKATPKTSNKLEEIRRNSPINLRGFNRGTINYDAASGE